VIDLFARVPLMHFRQVVAQADRSEERVLDFMAGKRGCFRVDLPSRCGGHALHLFFASCGSLGVFADYNTAGGRVGEAYLRVDNNVPAHAGRKDVD
jgi:hypothetical protein